MHKCTVKGDQAKVARCAVTNLYLSLFLGKLLSKDSF